MAAVLLDTGGALLDQASLYLSFTCRGSLPDSFYQQEANRKTVVLPILFG